MHPPASPSAPGCGARRWRPTAVAAVALPGSATAVTVARTSRSDRSSASTRSLTAAPWNMCGVEQWSCAVTGGKLVKKRPPSLLATAA
ncbi:hypothetical protein [Streptomyces sp. NPDC086182]|uniref:hypothetical protein n=1 Tax=Streptomyces sp. NPDC086182 TaxID=3155058 RepID=UPI0034149B25